ncbi:MAG: hypothetical protein ACK4IU_07010 [Tabrizicola flagellatus]|uniref:hypothetical protein n=1 Tax=Tabrizicola flagellatus TaxID=2593021 RepID=UPI00391AFD71
MKLTTQIRLIFLPILLASAPTSADAYSMRCKLHQVFQLTAEGAFQPNSLESAYLENDMVVDMTTGVVYHAGFGTEYYPIKKILDGGSRSSSFKLLASSIPGPASDFDHATFVNTTYLQIDTWVAETEKPFIVIESQNVGIGLCQ